MATHSVPRLTEDEYLAQERANPFRSEFVDGEMLAMAGGSLRHSALAAACIGELRSKLAGRCTVLTSDGRLRTPVTRSYVYPDVSVVCGPAKLQEQTSDILLNPTLVVEVLSPSTRNYDRSRKFDLYREIDSLKEYLLIDTDSITISHFSRQVDNSWVFREATGAEANVFLPALDITLGLNSIYNDVMNLPA